MRLKRRISPPRSLCHKTSQRTSKCGKADESAICIHQTGVFHSSWLAAPYLNLSKKRNKSILWRIHVSFRVSYSAQVGEMCGQIRRRDFARSDCWINLHPSPGYWSIHWQRWMKWCHKFRSINTIWNIHEALQCRCAWISHGAISFGSHMTVSPDGELITENWPKLTGLSSRLQVVSGTLEPWSHC